jgi:hypothetical protein
MKCVILIAENILKVNFFMSIDETKGIVVADS